MGRGSKRIERDYAPELDKGVCEPTERNIKELDMVSSGRIFITNKPRRGLDKNVQARGDNKKGKLV